MPDVAFPDQVKRRQGLLQGHGLRRAELGIEPARLHVLDRSIFQHGPAADVLVAELHALLPVGAVRRRCHAPLRRAVLVHHGAGLASAVREGRIPEDLLGDMALADHRSRFEEVHAGRFRRRVFLQPLDVFGQRVDGGRSVGVAAAGDRRADRDAVLGPDAPFVHRACPLGSPRSPAPAIESQASVKRQPSDGSFLP